ncbi:MAG: hypothetical protein IIA66_13935 [Planctomycetes bacterium]|nr:hypothetical protein [Planctomycetota bacterium]
MVLATALIVFLPNFAHRTFLQVVGVEVLEPKFFLVALAHRATWAAVQV